MLLCFDHTVTLTKIVIQSVCVCPDSGSRWKKVVVNGSPPCPRTYHTNSASLGDKLYVFSGGEAGASPVSDPKLHVLDTGLQYVKYVQILQKLAGIVQSFYFSCALSWFLVAHCIFCASMKSLQRLIEKTILNRATTLRLFCGLHSATAAWSQPETQGKHPPPRHGHIIIALGPNIYIHGGMSGDKFHNDMFSLDTSRSQFC